MRVSIYINEPWEIGGQTIQGELTQTMNEKHRGRGLIKLDHAIE